MKKEKLNFFQDVAFRSDKDDWQTPKWLFEILNEHFEFEADVCANHENALCDIYFTEENSCLDKTWKSINFMNPPYSKSMIKFIEKAHDEWMNNNCTTVALVPSRTDTRWFHNFVYNKADIVFIKGRLKFEGTDKLGSAPFPSMIAVWWGMPTIHSKKFLSNDNLQKLVNDKNKKQLSLKL